MSYANNKHRANGIIINVSALILLSGCAMTDPFIETEDWARNVNIHCIKTPNLPLCLEEAEKLREAFNKQSIRISDHISYFDRGGVALGVISAALGIYEDSTDMLRGAGLIGSSYYVFGEKYPRGKNLGIYETGKEMLRIVIENAHKGVDDIRGLEYGKRKDYLKKFLVSYINSLPSGAPEKKNLEQVTPNCLPDDGVVHKNEITIGFLTSEIYRTTNAGAREKLEEIKNICLKMPTHNLRSVLLIKERNDLEESLRSHGVTGLDPYAVYNRHKDGFERLRKVESELDSIITAAERIERLASRTVPQGAGSASKKVSIWLGLALLETRYAVEGTLANVRVAIETKSPTEYAKEIRGKVKEFTALYKSESDMANSNSSQP